MSKTHLLKTWPIPFGAILGGIKQYEIRKDDRGFAVGDLLELAEFDPHFPQHGYFTGRKIVVEVTYMSPGGSWGLPEDLCVMSIRKIP